MTVEETQVAVPSQGDDVDNQNSVVERNNGEVDSLNEWPDHPVLGQCSPVCALQLILGAGSLHHSHAAQEKEQVCAGEDGLIETNAGDGFEILVLQDDVVLEEFEPCGGCWSKDC